MEFMEDWPQIIYDHFTYAIVLINDIEIIDALAFAYYNLIKIQCFYAKKYKPWPILATNQMHSPWGRAIYPCWISSTSTLCTHGAIVKVVAGDAQPEAVFGYFYPADGGVGEE